MARPFEFFEIDENDNLFQQFPELKIKNNSPEYYIILRGITGNIKFKQCYRNIEFFQTIDYLDAREKTPILLSDSEEKLNIEANLRSEIASLISILKTRCKSNFWVLAKYISDSTVPGDIALILKDKKLSHRNGKFFETLNDEFCNFYYYTHANNHTLAFLHLYRILEYISYSFPLLYAASTKDFSKSFEELKALFNGDKDQGELKVFKLFITEVMSNEKEYDRLSIDINILTENPEHQERIFKTITNICSKDFFSTGRTLPNSRLSIKFSEFSSFIITVRNRFFHLKNSHDSNIKSIDIVDSDFFFSLLNKKCAYFISLVTFFIIKKSYFQ